MEVENFSENMPVSINNVANTPRGSESERNSFGKATLQDFSVDPSLKSPNGVKTFGCPKIPLIKQEGKKKFNKLSHKVSELHLNENTGQMTRDTNDEKHCSHHSNAMDVDEYHSHVKYEPLDENAEISKRKSRKRVKKDEKLNLEIAHKTSNKNHKRIKVESLKNNQKIAIKNEPSLVGERSTRDDGNSIKTKVEEESYEWWKETTKEQFALHPTWKWIHLEHQGVIFPPEYIPHGVKMLYDGNPVNLTPEQEEAATMFAKHLETQHGSKPQFCKNFFSDFVALLNSSSRKKHLIKKFELCDFTPILEHLKKEAEKRKNRTKEEKDAEKAKKNEIKSKYGYSIVDGHKEPLGNYMVEPPSLFLGRGDHPKTGHIKKRIYPEDITLNLSEGIPIPPCPISGHKWGGIVHNHEVAWIATWIENISGSNKYVLFGASSSIRGWSDRKKFEIARDLMNYIDGIRETYNADLNSEDELVLQRAAALWVIDNWALRIGNEKNEDEADTVGCCSLRVEHFRLHPPSTVELEFLGKDSMKYHRFHQVEKKIYKIFERLLRGKKKSELVFDQLKPASLNRHLGGLMKNLSAKVFRTYNASITLQNQLDMFEKEFGSRSKDQLSASELKLFYNRANRQVAILCNHQRTLSKNHEKQMEIIDKKIEVMKRDREILQNHLRLLESGVVSKKRGKEDDEILVPQKGVIKEETMEVPTTKEKELVLPDNPEKVKKKIASLDVRIKKIEINRMDKGEGSEIQNSTSKINYMDPRISVVWCNKVGLDLKNIFSNTLLAKFKWAIAEVEENPDFRWKKGDFTQMKNEAME